MPQHNTEKFCQIGQAVIKTELEAIRKLSQQINNTFATACEYLLNCEGRIIVIGMGKSGHIGRKIAATFASTGSPAFFVHPGEASHGDLGMITKKDVVLAISNSGTTQEILTILPIIKRLGIPLITLTGNTNSLLAQEANVYLDISIDKEACPLNLAPTSSTTASLVMGDALAIALLDARGFTQEDFALSHPGGRLGRRLLLRINDIMFVGNKIPKVHESESVKNALIEMSQKSLGMTAVVDESDKIVGIFTDGDLRRTLDKNINFLTTPIGQIITKQCATVTADLLAVEALQLMESKKITGLLVINDENKLVGALNIHNLLQSGVV